MGCRWGNSVLQRAGRRPFSSTIHHIWKRPCSLSKRHRGWEQRWSFTIRWPWGKVSNHTTHHNKISTSLTRKCHQFTVLGSLGLTQIIMFSSGCCPFCSRYLISSPSKPYRLSVLFILFGRPKERPRRSAQNILFLGWLSVSAQLIGLTWTISQMCPSTN